MPLLNDFTSIYVGASPVVAVYVGSTLLDFGVEAPPPWPPPDPTLVAVPINAQVNGSVNGTLVGAPDSYYTNDGGVNYYSFAAEVLYALGNQTRWYKWTVSAQGSVEFSNSGAATMRMGVFAGAPPLQWNDLWVSNAEEPANTPLDPMDCYPDGTEYWLMVANTLDDAGATYTVSWTWTPG